jgi:hypothetical protein
MAINKVIYGGRTLIDLSGDTVTADKILDGFTAHDKKGETITGTCKYDVDSSDATAAVAEILQGKTAYVRGKKLTGTMKNIVLWLEQFLLRMSNIQFLRDIMMVLVKLEL